MIFYHQYEQQIKTLERLIKENKISEAKKQYKIFKTKLIQSLYDTLKFITTLDKSYPKFKEGYNPINSLVSAFIVDNEHLFNDIHDITEKHLYIARIKDIFVVCGEDYNKEIIFYDKLNEIIILFEKITSIDLRRKKPFKNITTSSIRKTIKKIVV